MTSRTNIASAATAALLLAILAENALAQGQAAPTAPARTETSTATVTHKLAIQVTENRPEAMTLALNNAQNVADYYKAKGETVLIEIIAYGPGLHMLRDDTSPVKARVAAMSLAEPGIGFIACGNTQVNQSKQEGKPVPLIAEAKVLPSGVVRLMELQAKGYAYVRP